MKMSESFILAVARSVPFWLHCNDVTGKCLALSQKQLFYDKRNSGNIRKLLFQMKSLGVRSGDL